jgi:hypothetical protein
MSDAYLEMIQEHWPNILKLYEVFERYKPVMLYDIQEQRVYAYTYKESRADLSVRSRASLKDQYEAASAQGSMVIFVRDNLKRKLVSYTMDIQHSAKFSLMRKPGCRERMSFSQPQENRRRSVPPYIILVGKQGEVILTAGSFCQRSNSGSDSIGGRGGKQPD